MALVRDGSIVLGEKAMVEDFGHQFDLDLDTNICSQRCCHEKRSVVNTSSSHLTVVVTTTSDMSGVANSECEGQRQ